MEAPLLGAMPLDATVAWRRGQALSARQFVADAQAQALHIPAHAQGLVNLCADRYDFAVMLAAALLRRIPTLMPPNSLPATLALLHKDRPALAQAQELQALAGPEAVAQVDAVPEVPLVLEAAVLLTSGSTGTPVAHARSWRSMVLNAQAQADRMAHLLGRAHLQGVAIVATVPAQHSYGFESSVMLALLGGAAFDASRPFYPADIAKALAHVPRPRLLVTTPFHLKTLLGAELDSLPIVDAVISATAPLSPQLAAQAEQELGGPVFEVYGCTEAGQVATRHTTASPTWTTYGELRIEQRMSDQAGGGAAESYWVQGGHVFEPTPLADMLELDDGRHFRLLGRAGDLLHVAGKRSSLAHLNHQLNSIPGVQDGAFYMPGDDPSGGIVRPVAFVVAPTLTAADITRELRLRMDAVFVPRRIVLLDALPHEATGKITAATLRALALAHGVA